jgi:hypothetical protein
MKSSSHAPVTAVAFLLLTVLRVLAAPPPTDSERDLKYQLVYQRAVEAVLWSMPAMSDVFFRESMFKQLGMKPNQVMVMSRPLVARHMVLTANNQVKLCRNGVRPHEWSGSAGDACE